MGLVSLTEVLGKAKEENYAVGQFNSVNLESLQATLQAAQEANSPVILGVLEGTIKEHYMGYKVVADLTKNLIEAMNITVPVVLHLDHGTTKESCFAAIDAGFTSVMIDCSHSPLEENIQTTKEITEYAHKHGVSVEAEIGTVGGREDGVIGGIKYADPQECLAIKEQANIDALAAALGSVHGTYDGEPVLGFDEMKEISELTDLPLVLHGGSGIPAELIAKCIENGHRKINVDTECQQVFTGAKRDALANDGELYTIREIETAGKEALTKYIVERMVELGSANRA